MIPRSFFAAAFLAIAAFADPPLTTIQDVLYKADGTRFTGTLTISWTSFEAIDRSAIATQVTTVSVTDGNLRVQLVPTTTATPTAKYLVKYNSDGRIQFSETWAVPSSTAPLRVRDVRVASSLSAATAGADTGTTNPLQESDVTGLVADLGARPLKGPGYAAGRVAVVNPSGMMESAVGNASDCVHVDGSSGPCGGSQPGFYDGDSPSGIVDGANTNFALSATPSPASSLAVYRNGILQKSTQDYTASGNAIQFVAASTPQPGDTLLASYRLAISDDSGAAQTFPSSQVLCSGTGIPNTATSFASLGQCNIPGGVLLPGDRVEIHFDADHQGTAGGFSIEVHWGGSTALHRDAATGDLQVTGRADAAILTSGAYLSAESWGTVLPFAAGVANASDDYSSGVTIDFQGKVGAAGDTLTLRNYTVVRLP